MTRKDHTSALSAKRIDQVASEPVEWVWRDYLPLGKITVIDGDPGLGKSTVVADLTARVSVGGPMPNGDACQGALSVLLASAEDGIADTVRPRLEAHGADLARVHTLDEASASSLTLPDDIGLLEDVINRHQVSVVFIDPLVAYMSPKIDFHKDPDVRRVLREMQDVAQRTKCAIVFVRHLNKQAGGSALYRGGGSIGIIAGVRQALLVRTTRPIPASASWQ